MLFKKLHRAMLEAVPAVVTIGGCWCKTFWNGWMKTFNGGTFVLQHSWAQMEDHTAKLCSYPREYWNEAGTIPYAITDLSEPHHRKHLYPHTKLSNYNFMLAIQISLSALVPSMTHTCKCSVLKWIILVLLDRNGWEYPFGSVPQEVFMSSE